MRRVVKPRRQARDIAFNQQGIYRGKLAEPYDGIGQYVSVALAGSSVGSAYKARVAAGDFGGGRTFPRGTPVAVFSNRGLLEVLLGNIPISDTCVYLDDFDRIGSSTLGDATPGGYTWGFTTGAGYATPQVNGSEYEVQFTTSNRLAYAYFEEVDPLSVPDLLKYNEFEFKAKFQQSGLVSSGSDVIRFLWYGAGFSEEIRATVFLQPGASSLRLSTNAGSETNVAIPNISINTDYVIHLSVKTGEYARMSLYAADTGFESWQIDAADTGFDVSDSPLWDFSNELQNGHNFTRKWDFLQVCPVIVPTEIVCDIGPYMSAFWQQDSGTPSSDLIGADGVLHNLTGETIGWAVQSGATDFYNFLRGGPFSITAQFFAATGTPTDSALFAMAFSVNGNPSGSPALVQFVLSSETTNARVINQTFEDTGFSLTTGVMHTATLDVSAAGVTFSYDGAEITTISRGIDLSSISGFLVQISDSQSPHVVDSTVFVSDVTREDSSGPPWCVEQPVSY